VDSLGIYQANSIVKVGSVLRERAWHLCGLKYRRVQLSIDTTAETVYENQQGGRVGYNTSHQGLLTLQPPELTPMWTNDWARTPQTLP
jgi:hypothetical protein